MLHFGSLGIINRVCRNQFANQLAHDGFASVSNKLLHSLFLIVISLKKNTKSGEVFFDLFPLVWVLRSMLFQNFLCLSTVLA